MKFYHIAHEKKPYSIIKVHGGQPEIIINNIVIWAVSASQARHLALKKYPELRSYVEGCLRMNQEGDIEARLNLDELRKLEEQKKIDQQKQERKFENAWYNKD